MRISLPSRKPASSPCLIICRTLVALQPHRFDSVSGVNGFWSGVIGSCAGEEGGGVVAHSSAMVLCLSGQDPKTEPAS